MAPEVLSTQDLLDTKCPSSAPRHSHTDFKAAEVPYYFIPQISELLRPSLLPGLSQLLRGSNQPLAGPRRQEGKDLVPARRLVEQCTSSSHAVSWPCQALGVICPAPCLRTATSPKQSSADGKVSGFPSLGCCWMSSQPHRCGVSAQTGRSAVLPGTDPGGSQNRCSLRSTRQASHSLLKCHHGERHVGHMCHWQRKKRSTTPCTQALCPTTPLATCPTSVRMVLLPWLGQVFR